MKRNFAKNRTGVSLVGVVCTSLIACDSNTYYPDPIPSEEILKPVLIVAHRGGMAFAPENTAKSVVNAQRLMSDIIELDVQVRGDEIIVIHDFTLNRTTNCRAESVDADATIRETCDSGYHWLPGTNTFSNGSGFPYFRGRGLRIPLLDEVVQLNMESGSKFMLELKHVERGSGYASVSQALTVLLNFVVENSLVDRVWINSSNPYVLSRAEAALPEISTILSWGDQIPKSCEATVIDAIALGFDGVSLQAAQMQNRVGAECVELAQNAGLFVMFWVVNRPAEVRGLLQLKPDALLTDFPACLAALLHDMRIEAPYPEEVPLQAYLPKCG